MQKSYKFLWILFILPFFEPYYFEHISIMDTLFNLYKIIMILGVVFFYFFIYKRISKYIILLGIFLGWELFSTIIGKQDIVHCISVIMGILGLSMLAEIQIHKSEVLFFQSLYCLFTIFLWINFFNMLLAPEGVYSTASNIYYFWGCDNELIIKFITLIIIGIILEQHYKERKEIYHIINRINYLMILICIIISQSGTAFVIAAIVALYVFGVYRINLKDKFNYKWIIAGILLLNISFVVFRIQEKFSYFIQEILGKSISISGRTLLWAEAIKMIRSHFVFGIGMNTGSGYLKIWNGELYAHNTLLDIMAQYGIVGILLFAMLVFAVTKNISRISNSKVAEILGIGFLTMALHMLVESDQNQMVLYLLFVISYHCNKIYLPDKKDVRRHENEEFYN